MPEVVQTYIDTKDFIQVRKTQHNIVYSYQVDFSKHAPYETVPRIIKNPYSKKIKDSIRELTQNTALYYLFAKYIEPITYVLKYNTQTPTLLHHHKKYHPPMR